MPDKALFDQAVGVAQTAKTLNCVAPTHVEDRQDAPIRLTAEHIHTDVIARKLALNNDYIKTHEYIILWVLHVALMCTMADAIAVHQMQHTSCYSGTCPPSPLSKIRP